MGRISNLITLGLHLAGMIQKGFCSHLPENEYKLPNEVSRNLPLAECDMIIVSPEPYVGEPLIHVLTSEIMIKTLKSLSNVISVALLSIILVQDG